jgi:hypothetical protein
VPQAPKPETHASLPISRLGVQRATCTTLVGCLRNSEAAVVSRKTPKPVDLAVSGLRRTQPLTPGGRCQADSPWFHARNKRARAARLGGTQKERGRSSEGRACRGAAVRTLQALRIAGIDDPVAVLRTERQAWLAEKARGGPARGGELLLLADALNALVPDAQGPRGLLTPPFAGRGASSNNEYESASARSPRSKN